MKRANAQTLINFNIRREEIEKDFPNYDDIVLSANSGDNVYSCLIVTGDKAVEIGLSKFKKKYSSLK